MEVGGGVARVEAPATGGGAGVESSPLSPPLSPASATAAALANARWNPTKEQVTVLEGLYEHGLRTPNAEQIQHIAGRLREHGPIEAKNVFYWFQNHKARQRQKEKQESFAYFTRLLRRPPPLPVFTRPPAQPYPPLSACNNGGGSGSSHHQVMYRPPYYMPGPQAAAANAGYYSLPQAHHMAVVYPRMDMTQGGHTNPAAAQPPASLYLQAAAPYGTSNPLHAPPANGADGRSRSRETLELFPLQPTFLLPDKAGGATLTTSTPSASASFSGKSESLESSNSNAEALPFYDFFGLQSGGR